ncbi:protein phosphatase 1 regulatory subunit 7 [Phakopsora pachyrhizi]|uniref:Protein phosphatase 1 regulatory subunit 7 n=1 Tax=Phakopsora pachyrhizi TaxID=170000 RepID=A0AAV0AL77_PHAPC|nr:protein phosphatase 1 regulatory subunit 7 [Phakopsora pachyrhizi]CAH7669434.1 protein phosphatase 1 regulatory subunit 7 [Phakopsora pachyrhizi]
MSSGTRGDQFDEKDRSNSTNTNQSKDPTARLESSTLSDGLAERERILESLREESSKGELAWSLDNQELLEDFKDDTDEVDLSHSRIRTMRGFEKHFERFKKSLKKLILRQNLIQVLSFEPLISKIEDVVGDSEEADDHKGLVSDHKESDRGSVAQGLISPLELLVGLEELDLYDNQISKIQGLQNLTSLKSLDLSFNVLRKIENLESLSSLKTLYLIQNKITHIESLESLSETLTSLELGSNRIRQISQLDSLKNLTELWLGKNKISKLEGLSELKNLRSLSIQSNRITELENLEELINLEELYISHNGLKTIGDGLTKNKKIKVLDIAANQIEDLNGIESLDQLEEFWANDNKLTLNSFNAKSDHLSETSKPNLKTIYFERNPFQSEMGVNYRRKLKLICPQIIQIDATFVKTV